MNDKKAGLTRTIARFIVNTAANDIPPEVYEHAKVAFMDWLGVIMAGKDDPLVGKLIHYSDLMGGNEQASILGHGMKKSLRDAALINGAASHALDYDDSSMAFLGHPSVTMFPAFLALSEFKGKSGADFLYSYIMALKVGCAIGTCAGMEHYMSGWHSTSTMGHFASATGCSKLLGLNEEQTLYALGIAGTQASGLKISFGTMSKPFHAGKSGQSGMMAALLALDGFSAAQDVLEGPSGYFQVAKGHVDEEVINNLGKTWDIETLAQKYHASCHATHSPIEAALSITQKENIDYKDIKSIAIDAAKIATDAAGKTELKTGLEGKFSINYCVVNALIRGNTGMQAFTNEKVTDPEVNELMSRTTLTLDETLSSLESRVTIQTNDGRVFTTSADIMKDIPSLEMKKVKITDKFTDLVTPVFGESKTKRIVELILTLDKVDSMKSFVDMLE